MSTQLWTFLIDLVVQWIRLSKEELAACLLRVARVATTLRIFILASVCKFTSYSHFTNVSHRPTYEACRDSGYNVIQTALKQLKGNSIFCIVCD